MKYSALAFLAAAGLAVAQDPSSCADFAFAFPFCGIDVISATASSAGCTDFNNFSCLCSNSATILSALSTASDFSASCSALADPNSEMELTDAYSTLCSCVSNTALPPTTSTEETTTTTDSTSAETTGSSDSTSPIITLPSSTGSGSTGSTGVTSGTTSDILPTGVPSGVPSVSGAPTVSVPKQSSLSSLSLTKFTAAAATAGSFLPVGGVLGAVVGLLAYL